MPLDAFEPHPLVRALGKPAADFTLDDLVRAAEQLELRQVGLRYVGGDGRLKTLSFPVNSREHLVEVLGRGERVDGSSVFEDAETAASDVYIVPRYRTAFVNPFGARPSLDVLCALYDETGAPLPFAREQVVRRAAEVLEAETGMRLEALTELEYYVVEDRDELFPVEPERGYQESPPFSKAARVREEVLSHLASMGVQVKYVHGEVGNIREDDRQLVQHEIELLPVPLEQAADAAALVRWVVREVAASHGVEATFAPSVSADGAGNGLHVHTRLVRGDRSTIVRRDGLNDVGRRLVAGYLKLARAMSAFGNTVPASYLRFVDGGETPEGICWGERDRTGLVRVPLAWTGDVLPPMVAHANPGQSAPSLEDRVHPQTVELRLGDGSADVHLLLAGMAVAARVGLTADDSLEVAERLESDAVGDDAEPLPTSCAESADVLEESRAVFEEHDVFSPELVDSLLAGLRGHDDRDLMKRLKGDEEARAELVRRFWHVG